ncbi:tetratricopeptide repeat protein [Helicobacter sp. 23-1044]
MLFGLALAQGAMILAMQASDDALTLEACKGGDVAQCEQTIDFLKKSCDKKGAQSCFTLGYIYENGVGVEVRVDSAIAYYKRGCDLRSALGCVNAGAIYAKIKNFEVANTYFSRACELRNADGCFNLGISYLYGQGVRESAFLAKMRFNDAIELYEEACARGDANACQSVAGIYASGEAVEADLQKAEDFAQRACEIDERFCES